MAKPKVSIILPVRNSARFIRQALESAVTQSYDTVEILVVDGASTDGTQALVQSFPRVRLISEPDRGQADAANKGLARITGDIVLILCGDDVLHPDACLLAVETFEAVGDADIVFGKVGKIDASGRAISSGDSFGDFELKRLLLQNARFPSTTYPSTTAFLRKSLLLRTGFQYDVDMQANQDFDMWLRMGLHGRVVYVPHVLAYWREHADSGSVKTTSRQALIDAKRRALDKFFRQPSLRQDVRGLEAAARALLEMADWSCFLLRKGRILEGLLSVGSIMWNNPVILRYPHTYGLLFRSLLIGFAKRLGVYRLVLRTRMFATGRRREQL